MTIFRYIFFHKESVFFVLLLFSVKNSYTYIYVYIVQHNTFLWNLISFFQVICPPQEHDAVTFVPHPFDCSKFFMCHGDIPILMSCPGNLQFDPSLNVCNWPSAVGCENSTPYPITTTTVATTSTTSPTIKSTTTVPTTFPTTAPTTTLTTAPTTVPTTVSTTTPTTAPTTAPATTPTTAPTTPAMTSTTTEPTTPTTTPATTSRTSTTEATTPTSTPASTTTTITTAETTTHTISDSTTLPTNPTTMHSTSQDTITTTTQNLDTTTSDDFNTTDIYFDHEEEAMFEISCPPSEDGLPVYIPHPYDCNKYFQCVFDIAIEMSCPPYLQFDSNLNVCNFPDIVGCVNTPEPTTSTETITTTPEMPETTSNTTSSMIEENYDDEYFLILE